MNCKTQKEDFECKELTLVTEKMIAGGVCLAHFEGKTVLVSGALPQEKVTAKITSYKKDFYTAEIISVIEKNPNRTEPACKFYGICGGCNLQIANADYQRALKKDIFYDALVREGVLQEQIPAIELVAGKDFGYRSRFQLHDGGLKMRASNNVVPIKDCLVAKDSVRKFLQNNCAKNLSGRCHLFADDNSVVIAKDATQARGKFAGTITNDATKCTVTICGKKICFDVRGFFQSNIEMLEKTIFLVKDFFASCANFERAIDIYSGVATFSVFLKDLFKEVYLVEHNRDAIVMAEKNLRNNNTSNKHQSYGVSGATWAKLPDANKHFDFAIVDPPRSGMEKALREWLKQKRIAKLACLSCDPVTFSRDAKDLLDAGYKMQKLFLLDYYPQTSHIETLAFFTI